MQAACQVTGASHSWFPCVRICDCLHSISFHDIKPAQSCVRICDCLHSISFHDIKPAQSCVRICDCTVYPFMISSLPNLVLGYVTVCTVYPFMISSLPNLVSSTPPPFFIFPILYKSSNTMNRIYQTQFNGTRQADSPVISEYTILKKSVVGREKGSILQGSLSVCCT